MSFHKKALYTDMTQNYLTPVEPMSHTRVKYVSEQDVEMLTESRSAIMVRKQLCEKTALMICLTIMLITYA